jgi:hypothetical protein
MIFINGLLFTNLETLGLLWGKVIIMLIPRHLCGRSGVLRGKNTPRRVMSAGTSNECEGMDNETECEGEVVSE